MGEDELERSVQGLKLEIFTTNTRIPAQITLCMTFGEDKMA